MAASLKELCAGVRSGDRGLLARAITLIESTRPDDMQLARELLEKVAGDRSAIRVGITGVPGVGKSSFIDALGSILTDQGQRVAVLAVDPSSSLSGGSILGDKTRMERLSRHDNAFIRPSPGGNATGGVARTTREAMLLCEAAGFDVVCIETIGVGQSEITVAHMVDTFVLLLLAGAGDELQGIKRGIMELADLVVVNKADGDNKRAAEVAASEYANALSLLPSRHPSWKPPALTCSAHAGTGLAEVWEQIGAHRAALGDEGIGARRSDQALYWFDESLRELVLRDFLARDDIASRLPGVREKVRAGRVQPTAAVLDLLGGG